MTRPPFYVWALNRSSNRPRPMAGPFALHESALKLLPKVLELGIARHYISPHSDAVYVGACPLEQLDAVGILNRWLPDAMAEV